MSRNFTAFPSTQQASRLDRVGAEDHLQEFGPTRAEQAGDPEDLAPAQLEIDSPQRPAGDAPGLERHLVALHRRHHRIHPVEGPTGDELDQPVLGDLVADQGAGQASVAQHRGLGGGVDHLVQPVAHEQDGLTGRREPVQGPHQTHHLGPGQRRRRLVEDEDPGVLTLLVLQGPGDGHHGPLGRSQRADQRLGTHVDLEAVEQGLGLAAQSPPPDGPDRSWW